MSVIIFDIQTSYLMALDELPNQLYHYGETVPEKNSIEESLICNDKKVNTGTPYVEGKQLLIIDNRRIAG